MARNFGNFLEAYVSYVDHTEAPAHFHYWVGVTLIAALMGRRVWCDAGAFKVYPNFYLMLVAPPDIVKKSASMSRGVGLLKQLEDFHLGPSTITWQALIKSLKEAECTEEVYPGVYVEMSNMFIASGEMGSFLNPEDRQSMDMLVKLWDGEEVDKVTVGNGNFKIEKPLLSFVTCTTPAWVRQNIPEYMIEGGLLSRIVAVYAEKRERRVFWPAMFEPKNSVELEHQLIEDLENIRNLRGDVVVPAEVLPFMKEQYDRICDAQEAGDSKTLRRKQVQIIKLAMILAAATNSIHKDHLYLTIPLLAEAEKKINELEEQRKEVFRMVGKSRHAVMATIIMEIVEKSKGIEVKHLYREMFNDMPNKEEFNMLILSMQKAGLIEMRRPEGVSIVCLAGR